jgi:hypothetical protein
MHAMRRFVKVSVAVAIGCLATLPSAAADGYDALFEQRYEMPEDIGVLGRFVSKAVESGLYDQAISTLEQHLIRHPRDSRARLNLAQLYANVGSWELAARNANVALSVGDLSSAEVRQAEDVQARAKSALAGFQWVLDMTVGVRSTWLDVDQSRAAWHDRQDWNPFAAFNTALRIDLDTPLNDSLTVSASGLLERRYEDINQGANDPITPAFDPISGIYAHHQGQIAMTLDKGVPVTALDALRFQFTAFGQFRTFNPSLTEVALGTSVRMVVQPSVDTSAYVEGLYANLDKARNLLSQHRYAFEAGASKRLSEAHTIGAAGRYQRELTSAGTTINRYREVEMIYAGVLPMRPMDTLWTHRAAFALGDFSSRDGAIGAIFSAPGTGTFWRASWNHAFHLDGHNRIDLGYVVREFDHDVSPSAFDPSSLVHTISLSFTKSF